MVDIMDARVKIDRPAPPSRESAFRAARAHSRLVRFLKIAVPATAVAGVGLFVVLAWFNPFRQPPVPVPAPPVVANNGALDVMLPHLTGVNSRGQKYDVKATTGSQKVTAPGIVSLTNLNAVISSADQSNATLTAATGKFDSNTQMLFLKDDVHVKSTKGYDAVMKSGTIDFKGSTVHSDEPVTVNLSNGVISANNLDIVQGGSKITFAGGVSATFSTPLKPGGGDDAASDDTSSDSTPTDDADPTGSTPSDTATPAQGSPSQ
ncbi:LPS export ABC transporter periplasmic protein LptC [Labrys okinawensis]|uniref:LPS export ABC transporter periplasmic protein LptC n=1 Tax=Labrys okinawensis TaxID=346911 RepID=UPI0039BD8EEB